jgi:hypothetical protein
MAFHSIGNVIALWCVFQALQLAAQTSLTAVDTASQTRNHDFSLAPFTKPFRLSSSLPATCSTGEALYLTTAAPGKNVYLCTAPNAWSATSGVTILSTDLGDCKVSLSGPDATVAAPCRLRMATALRSLSANAVATLSGTAVSGTVYFYWDNAGNFIAAENTAATLSCNSFCIAATGSNFPLGSTPVASASFVNNLFTAVTDLRTPFDTKNIVCGNGLICTENASSGETTILADTTQQLLTKSASQSGQLLRCVSTAASSAHSCSLSPPLLMYSTGMVVEFVASAAALSGAATLNIDGLGAKAIKQADGVADASVNQLAAGQQAALRFDGTVFRLPAVGTLLTPGANGQTLISDSGAATGFVFSDRSQAGPFVSLPSCGPAQSGLVFLFTDSLYSLARCDGALWSHFFDGRQVNPPSGSWMWDNQTQGGTASLDSSRGFHLLSVPATHTTGYAVRYQTAPSGNYSRTFAVRLRALLGLNSAGYMVGFRDAGGKLHGLNISYNSAVSASAYLIDVRRQDSAAAAAGSFDFGPTALASLPTKLYLRIADDTVNTSFAYSADGFDFHTLYSGPRDSYLGSPAQIYFAASAAGAASGAALDVISIQ